MSRIILGLGLVLVLSGIGVVGMVIYQNFLPDQEAVANADAATNELRNEWAQPTAVDGTTDPASFDVTKVGMTRPLGKGFAIMYIPRLGNKWRAVVVEGVAADTDLLGKIGHFEKTSDPGMVGNFALAAHRLTKGSLFRYLDEVKDGDQIIVETRTHWYVYTVTGTKIIEPTAIEVISPVPFKPGKKPTKAVITLTTCSPWYSSTQRLAVFGDLTEIRLKPMGPPAGLPKGADTAVTTTS